jgi:hypothetical protein
MRYAVVSVDEKRSLPQDLGSGKDSGKIARVSRTEIRSDGFGPVKAISVLTAPTLEGFGRLLSEAGVDLILVAWASFQPAQSLFPSI